jgi:hypothetical protein
MEREELPAVVTVGGTELTHSIARVWQELESGAVVRVVNKRSGRHRAWIVPELPAGYEAERISVNELLKNAGRVLDDVRDGTCFEVFDHVSRTASGYVIWAAPDCLAALACVIPYTVRTRTGRRVQRDMWPLAVAAERPVSRRAVLASA